MAVGLPETDTSNPTNPRGSEQMKLTEAERERIALCHHEASHAIAGVLHGGRVEVAEVFDRERNGEHGRVTFTGLPADAEPVTAYSGPWGQARYLHGPHPAVADIRAVLASTGSCDHATLIASGGGLVREVEPLLETCWPAVASLAGDLYLHGRANHDAVLAALGAASEEDLPMIKSLIKSKTWEPGLTVARA